MTAANNSKIDRKFPASIDAKISPDKPRTSDTQAAIKVRVRLPSKKRRRKGKKDQLIKKPVNVYQQYNSVMEVYEIPDNIWKQLRGHQTKNRAKIT